ncbi:uncharacterized protein BDW43DRAFT_58549 [Aspergillus alliaceus]|uniref:uncharacterized protein n=1 Tax=Petromyces alliaceus TaxID=209559 RepID=UPI0012A517E7|nr:uncharacterized protein BDW43DRAFT_58549 [Aspergillus alliaceus]KAB8234246.1 hypothetical protein BDW43DRAFT_58549 [Aspergillus alliaceus]
MLDFLWNKMHTSGNGFMNQDALDFIADRTIEACDEIDGVREVLIENSLKCDFDIKMLQCEPGQTAVSVDKTRCLTPVQIQSDLCRPQGCAYRDGDLPWV